MSGNQKEKLELPPTDVIHEGTICRASDNHKRTIIEPNGARIPATSGETHSGGKFDHGAWSAPVVGTAAGLELTKGLKTVSIWYTSTNGPFGEIAANIDQCSI